MKTEQVVSERGVFFLSALSRGLLHFLWPVYCPACGKIGESVCRSCLLALMEAGETFCMHCGAAAPCAAHPGGPYVYSAAVYDAQNREVVHRMKYAQARDIAGRMGELLGEWIPDTAGVDALVPIPLHKGSERDYNQTELMARGLSSVRNIPVRAALTWKHAVPRQAQRVHKTERNLPGDAMQADATRISGLRVLLVDDIYTTGNTMQAARGAVERAGGIVAGAAVWCRSLPGG